MLKLYWHDYKINLTPVKWEKTANFEYWYISYYNLNEFQFYTVLLQTA